MPAWANWQGGRPAWAIAGAGQHGGFGGDLHARSFSSSGSSSSSDSDSDSDSDDEDDDEGKLKGKAVASSLPPGVKELEVKPDDDLPYHMQLLNKLEKTTSKKQAKIILDELLRNDAQDVDEDEELAEQAKLLERFPMTVIGVNRTAKVTKGGKVYRFNALVVAGNRDGFVGFGRGKAQDAGHAVNLGYKKALNNIHFIDRYREHTIYHDTTAKFCRTRVELYARHDGAGIKANNVIGAICRLAGIKNIGAKVHGSHNEFNTIQACFKALESVQNPYEQAEARGKKCREIIRYKGAVM